jgi:DNA gyrase/topoisomerase IV subunit B
MNADQLRETVFEPGTRRLLQISMEDAALVAETVNLLMGSQAGARRIWLEGAARDVEVEV